MLLQTSEKARAVFFFDKNNLVGELLYPEFESMLDGFVPAKEWALRTVHAAYAEINHKLAITAAVFFKIGFDDHGWVDGSWNLPLADLAHKAASGPDLGAGPIQLATAQQSPVELWAPMLWNPDPKGRNSHLAQLKKAIARNRLGLCFVADASAQAVQPGFNAELFEAMERRLSSVLAQHLNGQRENEIRETLQQVMDEQARVPLLQEITDDRQDYVSRLEKVLQDKDDSIKHLSAQVDSLQERTKLSQEQFEGQVKKTEGLREYYEHKLERMQQEHLAEVVGAPAQNIEQIVQEATLEFADLLQRKEIELLYRSEREEQLLAQLKRLQNLRDEQDTAQNKKILLDLMAAGISLVAFQPGAEPLVIEAADVDIYLANPNAFAAKLRRVDEGQYLAWLKHYHMPVCQAQDAEGNMCNESLNRVLDASQFVEGVSNFCLHHRSR